MEKLDIYEAPELSITVLGVYDDIITVSKDVDDELDWGV